MTRVLSLPLLAVLWLYRKLISPALPPACRYYPAAPSTRRRRCGSMVRSSALLALRRLLRCHPWAVGGPDLVPPRTQKRTA